MKLKVVYYMPSEEVFKKDEISRELCLVLQGSCHLIEDDKVKRVVRDDVSSSELVPINLTPRKNATLYRRINDNEFSGSEYGPSFGRTGFLSWDCAANGSSHAS